MTGNDGTNVLDHVAETITGEFTDGADADLVSDHVTYTATRPSAGIIVQRDQLARHRRHRSRWGHGRRPAVDAAQIKFVVSMPVVHHAPTHRQTDFANHGEYVAAQGGGSVAAQKCTGMPLVSKQGK